MIQRCEDANCDDYKYYGARGITVAAEWHDFQTFLKDVGERPKGLTLDRVRNNEGYGPRNFRWATRQEQVNNMRSNVKTYVDGKLLSIKEMAEKAGISYRTMHARLTRLGYSAEEALCKPVKCGGLLPTKDYPHLRDQSWRNFSNMHNKPRSSKLNAEQVNAMRLMHEVVAASYSTLALMFDVSIETASNAVQGLKAYAKQVSDTISSETTGGTYA